MKISKKIAEMQSPIKKYELGGGAPIQSQHLVDRGRCVSKSEHSLVSVASSKTAKAA